MKGKYEKIPLKNELTKKKTKSKKDFIKYFVLALFIFSLVILIIHFIPLNNTLKNQKNVEIKNESEIIFNEKKNESEFKDKKEIKSEKETENINEKERFDTVKIEPFNKYSNINVTEEKLKDLKDLAIYKLLLENGNKKIKDFETLALKENARLGNQIVVLNNAIVVCELLGCKRIIVHPFDIIIKKTVYYEKYNITIEPYKQVDCNNKTIFCISTLYNLFSLGEKCLIFRTDVFKEELLSNFPKIKTDPNDLYIHFRTGDVFNAHSPARCYPQPPLCFYRKIIEGFGFNFTKIHLVAEDKGNPLIDELIKLYPGRAIYESGSTTEDAAKFMYAYNVVGSISSYLTSSIRFNDNLKYFWNYIILPYTTTLLLDFEQNFYPRKCITYAYYPSENYKKSMNPFTVSKYQINLMFNEKCNSSFYKVEPAGIPY